MASLRDAGASPPNSYWQARTPAVSSWRSLLQPCQPCFPRPRSQSRCVVTQACLALSVRVSHARPVPQTSSRLSVRLSVHQRRSLVLHLSARRCVSASVAALGGSLRISPPPTRHSGVGRRLRVGGGAARHNLSNALNVTTVIRGGHNAQ